MPKYARLDNSKGNTPAAIIEIFERTFTSEEQANINRKFGLDKSQRMVPAIEMPAPAPGENETSDGFGPWIVEDSRIVRTGRNRTLTQDEIDELALTANQSAKVKQAIAGLKTGEGTIEQRLVRIERILARLTANQYL